MSDRQRGTEVTILDIQPLIAESSEWVRTKRLDLVDKGVIGVRSAFDPWGVFKDALGNQVLVCNEGVGYYVLDDAPAGIPMYSEYDHSKDGPQTVSMMPLGEASVTVEYVEQNLTDEVVDLADIIRTFGSRLEGNFHALRRLATDESAAREAVDQWRSEDATHV